MDLSDGSDGEEELDYDLDENDILGGSDDEEKGNGQYDEQQLLQGYGNVGNEDYLDLETGGAEEDLNLTNNEGVSKVAPVKVRNVTEPKVDYSQNTGEGGEGEEADEEAGYERHPSVSSAAADASSLLDDDEDEDEEKTERSRFHNERQPTQPAQSVSTGSPIRSLGQRYPGSNSRGGGRGYSHSGPRGNFHGQQRPPPRHFMHMNMRPPLMMHMNRPPGPPGLMRGPIPPLMTNCPPQFMNRMGGPMQQPHPFYQFQEGILTDFNDPGMREQMPHSLQQRQRFPGGRQPFFRQNNSNVNLKQVNSQSQQQQHTNANAAVDQPEHRDSTMAPPGTVQQQQHNLQNVNQAHKGSDRSGGPPKDSSNLPVIVTLSEPQKPNDPTIYMIRNPHPSPPKPKPRSRFPQNTGKFQNGPVRAPFPVDQGNRMCFPSPQQQQYHPSQPQQRPFFDGPMNQQNFPPPSQQQQPQGGQFIPQQNWVPPPPQQQPQPQMIGIQMSVPVNAPQFPQQFQPQPHQNPAFIPQPGQPQLMMGNFMPPPQNPFMQRPQYIEPQPQFPGGQPVPPGVQPPPQFVSAYEYQQHQPQQQPPPTHQFPNQPPMNSNYQDPHMFHQQNSYHYQQQQQQPPPHRDVREIRDHEQPARFVREDDDDFHRERFRRDERSPLKRRYEDERGEWDDRDSPPREHRKARLLDRLGPPPQSDPDKNKNDEIQKIIEETKKELGLAEDDEYLRKIEEQKRKREEILRQKEARRKGILKDKSEKNPSAKPSSQKSEASRSTPEPAPPVSSAAVTQKSKVYLNPKTFNGDLLSALDSKLKKINMSIVSSSVTTKDILINTNTTTTTVAKNLNMGKPTVPPPTSVDVKLESKKPSKGKTILRVVRNKKGEIISKSKVVVMKSQHIPTT